MLPKELEQEIEFCRNIFISEIAKTIKNSDLLKAQLTSEVLISIAYIKIFSAYLKLKTVEDVEEAWKFMNEIKGVIEKIFYINNYLERIEEYIKTSKNKA